MSALCGSRSAANLSVVIAASQSSATSALLPSANSGSSFAQSASDVATVMVQIGQSSDTGFVFALRSEPPGGDAACHTDTGMVYAATPATSAPKIAASTIERIMTEPRVILSSPRQECLGLPNLRPLGIGVPGEIYELAEILGSLCPIAHRIGGARGAPESAVAVGRLLECDLVFLQRCRGLPDLQQQFRQHFAQRIEAVLHNHVLEAAVLAVSGRSHEPHRLVACALLRRHPCGCREHLLLGAGDPAGRVRDLQR